MLLQYKTGKIILVKQSRLMTLIQKFHLMSITGSSQAFPVFKNLKKAISWSIFKISLSLFLNQQSLKKEKKFNTQKADIQRQGYTSKGKDFIAINIHMVKFYL